MVTPNDGPERPGTLENKLDDLISRMDRMNGRMIEMTKAIDRIGDRMASLEKSFQRMTILHVATAGAFVVSIIAIVVDNILT